MRCKKYFLISLMLFMLFAIFTVAVMFIDVKQIGPKGSEIGFATINGFFLELFGVNLLWYKITDIIGILAILTAATFGFIGALELLERKSFFKVDKNILFLGAIYVLTILFYIFFKSVTINYRPIMLDGILEASYPSSHTMLTITVFGTAIIITKRFIASGKLTAIIKSVCIVLISLAVIGRMISGVHWITDIFGSILLSSAIITLYYAFVVFPEKKFKE